MKQNKLDLPEVFTEFRNMGDTLNGVVNRLALRTLKPAFDQENVRKELLRDIEGLQGYLHRLRKLALAGVLIEPGK